MGIFFDMDGFNFPVPDHTYFPPLEYSAIQPRSPIAERIQEAIRRKIETALFTFVAGEVWHVYARRDGKRLQTDVYPCVYVVNLAEQIIEEETDNRVLVAYPCDVILMVNEKTVLRTAPDLISLRRLCVQAVHTTRYEVGLPIESMSIVAAQTPIDGLDAGITATAFGVILGVLEPRSIAEEYP